MKPLRAFQLGVAFVVVAWVTSAVLESGSREEGIAAVRQELADSAAAHAREDSTRNAALEAALADSAAVWARRTDEARAARAEAEARAEEGHGRADAIATTLVARLDSTENAMFARYQEERDSIDAATDMVVDALVARAETAEAERDAVRALLFGKDEEIGSLRAEVFNLRAAVDALEARVRELEPSALDRIVDLGEKGLAGKALIDMVVS